MKIKLIYNLFSNKSEVFQKERIFKYQKVHRAKLWKSVFNKFDLVLIFYKL